jgi:hypothetical protein
VGFRMIENAGDGRQRIIGRIALGQIPASKKLRNRPAK